MSKSNIFRITLIFLGCVTAVCIWMGVAIAWSFSSAKSLQAFQFVQAQKQAQRAAFLVKPLQTLSLGQPDLEAWLAGLDLIQTTSVCGLEAQTYLTQTKTLPDCIELIKTKLTRLETQIEKSWWIGSSKIWQQNQTKLQSIDHVLEAAETILTGKNTVIVLLQNSQELRATGGFMGSFVQIELDNGQLVSMELFDIYQPDGQFDGYLAAPPGVDQYLSGGKGLRLPDANWHPDFPSSAEQILRFFALAGRQNVSTVLAVNLSVAEDLLRVTGNLTLPDYNITVTPENLAQVARADRADFFAGSYQKVNFLSALLTTLKLKLQELPTEKKAEIAKIFQAKILTKDILAYSNKPELQSLFEVMAASGQLQPNPQTLPFYLVESNVGINKANQQIARQVELEFSPLRITTTIHFENKNSADSGLHYGNYQRLITAPTAKVHTITVGDQTLESWDEDLITNSLGESFSQIGFFVDLPLNQTKLVTIEIVPIDTTTPFASNLFIFKQPGLPNTPYLVKSYDQTNQFILEQDTLLELGDIIN